MYGSFRVNTVSIIIVIANPKMSGTVRVTDLCVRTLYGKIRVA